MNGNKPDMEKRLYWRRILEEAATSGISTREFCRQRRLKETQFYWWRRMLNSASFHSDAFQTSWDSAA